MTSARSLGTGSGADGSAGAARGDGLSVSSSNSRVVNSTSEANSSIGLEERRSSSVYISSKKRDEQERIKQVTMNRLRKTSLGLHGREKEVAQLSSCLAQVSALEVRGISGSNRTSSTPQRGKR